MAQFAEVRMPFHAAGLTPREVKLVHKLVDASQYLEQIYWRQMDPDGLALYTSLEDSRDLRDLDLRRYLR
ncbi:MAG: Zn-dependent hydrolase, partial [Gaiellaceae bacterium]